MEYYKPKTLKEAEKLKNKFKSSAYLAGGTVLNWKGLPKTKVIIDLNNLTLNKVEISEDKVVIGSLVTIQELLETKKLPKPIVAAAKNFNSINVRNVATIGGNICDKFFVSNLLPLLLAYNAKIKYFIKGKQKTVLLINWIQKKEGIVTALIIDKLDRTVSDRQERISEMDISSIVTSVGYLKNNNKISDFIIAVSGGSANTTILPKTADYILKNIKTFDEQTLLKLVNQDIKFIENIKVSKRVKLNLVVSQLLVMLKSL